MKRIAIESKEDCCGCGACVAACPHNGLAMVRDEEGFDYPVADAAVCTNCGRCLEVCPVTRMPDRSRHRARPAVHSVRHADETVRAGSSSGGAFSALAIAALADGATVYGAAFLPDFTGVRHVAARTTAELGLLRGSKYVQSDTVAALRAVVGDLDAGRRVLFVGTPCQVAGLGNLVGGPPEGLLTCDLVCHGVPSPGVFAQYMAEQEQRHGAPTVAYDFRSKRSGWNCPSVRRVFAGGRVYERWNWGDPFMRGFLLNVFLRPACHVCRFTGLPRFGDLTLGDYWGVAERFPDEDDNRGTSLVLANTEAGEALLRSSIAAVRARPGDLDHAIAHNGTLVRPTPAPPAPRRERCFDALRRSGSFAAASRTYTRLGFLLKRKGARACKRAAWWWRSRRCRRDPVERLA